MCCEVAWRALWPWGWRVGASEWDGRKQSAVTSAVTATRRARHQEQCVSPFPPPLPGIRTLWGLSLGVRMSSNALVTFPFLECPQGNHFPWGMIPHET